MSSLETPERSTLVSILHWFTILPKLVMSFKRRNTNQAIFLLGNLKIVLNVCQAELKWIKHNKLWWADKGSTEDKQPAEPYWVYSLILSLVFSYANTKTSDRLVSKHSSYDWAALQCVPASERLDCFIKKYGNFYHIRSLGWCNILHFFTYKSHWRAPKDGIIKMWDSVLIIAWSSTGMYFGGSKVGILYIG